MDPTHLGPYTITSRLGRGGMGAVYEAEDTLSGRTVAVKTLLTQLDENAGVRRRFQAEIETLKALRHPGIVQLLAYGEERGQPYFAMELVRGRSLEQMLRDGRRFSWRETVSVALAIARALKYAHDNGVIHRDLKPANLLLTRGGDTGGGDSSAGRIVTVKLADFGIARLFGDTSHTMAGTVVGTAEYMSPEQARGDLVDHRTDIYALGLVMFAMLAGKPPFHGGRAMQLIERQKTEPPPRVSSLVADVPPALDELIDRMLAKDVSRRPPNALALAKLLTHVVTLADDTTAALDLQATTPQAPGAGPAIPAAGTAALHGEPQPTVAPTIEPTRPGRPAAAGPQPPGPRSAGAAAGRPEADLFGETRDMPPRTTPTVRPTFPAATSAATESASAPQPSPVAAARRAGSPPTARGSAGGPLATVPEDTDGGGGGYRDTRHVEVEDLERIERRQESSRRLRQAVAGVAAFAAVSTGIGLGGWLMFRTPTADELMARIEKTIAAAPDRVDATKGVLPDLERFLAVYPDDARAGRARALVREVDIDRLARRARLRERKAEPPHLRVEREYRQAMALQQSDPRECLLALQAILALPRESIAQPLSPSQIDDELVRDPELWLDLVRTKLTETLPLARADDRARRQDASRAEEPPSGEP
jgi:serine/threonine protein kinase